MSSVSIVTRIIRDRPLHLLGPALEELGMGAGLTWDTKHEVELPPSTRVAGRSRGRTPPNTVDIDAARPSDVAPKPPWKWR